ncbi:two-component system, sensor histidine kinase YesM [Cohnella sp. OV330]|uniref:cache domain-containing sensor histidine kinase n=1 Tax=Cohnella sp. OV330 TaxID=1855288 RepID=UPI0008E09B4A|nr:sensor histidine kinase [Cohnella sp. OV330]SFA92008.1 two-component system, sensor histidine kinase YesM [Cohnella sp. OV330]
MHNALNRILLKLKLKHKLLLSYLLLILLPILYLQLYASGKVAGIIQEMVSFSLNQSFNQTHSFLSYKMKRITDTSDLIALDEDQLTRILKRDPSAYSLYEQLEDGNKLSQFLESYRDGTDVVAVKLYMPDGFLYAGEGSSMFRLIDAQKTHWYEQLQAAQVKLMWFSGLEDTTGGPGAQKVTSLVRLIRNPDHYNEPIGLLRLDLNERVLKEIVSRANTVKNSLTYLQRSDGAILIASDDALMKRYFPDAGEEAIAGNGELEFLQLRIPDTDLTMVTAIPRSEIVSKSASLQRSLLISLIGVALLAMLLAHIISLNMTRRITHLSQKMKSMETGALEPIVKPAGEDEIGELIHSYNAMSRQLALLKDVEVRAVKSEMKALQSQINPHFLYNTLDQINWMAQFGMNDQIASLVQSLARYYKLTLSNGQDIITIGQELELIAYYVEIQNVRFEQKIELIAQVDEPFLQGLIPKLTLQPIVENAILHGILGSENREGSIAISCERKDDRIVLTVMDDGAGVDEEQLGRLRAGARLKTSGSGYGIRNVQERIKVYYGDSYGLQFFSSPGDGMAVEIHIPFVVGAE